MPQRFEDENSTVEKMPCSLALYPTGSKTQEAAELSKERLRIFMNEGRSQSLRTRQSYPRRSSNKDQSEAKPSTTGIDVDVLEYLNTHINRRIGFWSPSLAIEGYVMATSHDSVKIAFNERPPNIDDREVWDMLRKALCRQSAATRLVDKAAVIALRRGLPIPEEFFCPITLDIMRDPVVASDGRTYECAALQRWLQGHSRSPLTNGELNRGDLRGDRKLRSAIDHWAKEVIGGGNE
eukprot:CAMPEP_0113704494 /NCGR_PEP_ID=MMETSP0038_2-20120614/26552_1 /TAXON_ID=2898 /ORGANISM="Cryptomonas paramecium" /LENGTH=236 /DNA_ID=CAMNT_0000629285 /DNA_START=26 /DNA_END=736 /DNA_ORIENTATION=- /assembly_acc=CAM_ASM_000170